MRNIMELMEASKDELPEIYCDMDQVLCDFIGGAGKAIGSPFVTADKNTRWDDIAQTKDFWEFIFRCLHKFHNISHNLIFNFWFRINYSSFLTCHSFTTLCILCQGLIVIFFLNKRIFAFFHTPNFCKGFLH